MATSREVKSPISRATKETITVDSSTRTTGNIAAIDFGTTSLSLSYTTVGDSEASVFSFDSNSNVPRVPNAILLKKIGTSKDMNYEVQAIGTTAQKRFHTMRSSTRNEHVYFERIKMMLMTNEHVPQEISRQTHITSVTGETFYLVQIIAFIIKQVAYEFTERLKTTVKPLQKHEFDWVVTVPAIWTAKGKRLMREAVYLSGILTEDKGITTLSPVSYGIDRPPDICPEKLTLALEPEVAAIYSQIICKQQAEAVQRKLSPGYMVVDAGGGTIDITAQIEVKGGVKIVSIPTGNDYGGTQVNRAFSKKFQQIVGDDNFCQLLSDSSVSKASEVLTTRQVEIDKLLYVEFENQKVSFGQDKVDEIAIIMPKPILSFYGEDRIAKGVEGMHGYDFEDDVIYITKEASEELFSEALTAISDCTLDALSANNLSRDIGTIYLVGGFGSCTLIQRRLQKDLKNNFPHIEVILPTSPLLAVVQGAVMSRQNPSRIQARPSDATYGVAVSMEYDSSLHDQRYINDSKSKPKYCRDIFEVFLLKNESVSYKDVFISDLRPSDDATKVTLTIYSTQELGVQYVNTPDGKPLARPIGQLIVDAPNPGGKFPSSKRQIKVKMSFSGTEIQATAKYMATGREEKTVCDFLSPI